MTPSLARFSLLLLLHVGCANEADTIDEPTGDGGTALAPNASAGASAPLGRASGLPCEVQELLAGYCVTCHGKPLTGGAPRSLLSHADLTAVVPSGSSKVAQLALTLMKDGVMPPTTARPSAAQIAAFAAWLDKGAPETLCGKAP